MKLGIIYAVLNNVPVTLTLPLSGAVRTARIFNVSNQYSIILEVATGEDEINAHDRDIQIVLEGVSLGSSNLTVELSGGNTVIVPIVVIPEE